MPSAFKSPKIRVEQGRKSWILLPSDGNPRILPEGCRNKHIYISRYYTNKFSQTAQISARLESLCCCCCCFCCYVCCCWVISGYRYEEEDICFLLGYYAAYSGNSLPTFRVSLSVSSVRAFIAAASAFLAVIRRKFYKYSRIILRPTLRGC